MSHRMVGAEGELDVDGRRLESDQFVVLIARHERRVRAFIATLVAFNAEAIDEVLQSTYVVAWRKLESFTYTSASADEEAVRWICTIARFEVLTYLRERKKQKAMIAFDEKLINAIADVQIEESEYLNARRQALSVCVERLDQRQQETIRLRYGVGLSMAELAARQGRQVNAATVALSRIRKALEKCVELTLRKEGLC